MIDDGYNESTDAAGLHIEYRPLLARQARELLQRIRRHGEPAAFRMADRSIAGALLDWDRAVVPCWHSVETLRREDQKVWVAVFRAVCGVEPKIDERADARNLSSGVALHVLHPQVARTDCGFCLRYWHDPIDGQTARRGGELCARPVASPPLCQTPSPAGKASSCPKGTPENPRTLSPKNLMAFRHYLECRAVGRFPDDPIVRRNARIIRHELDRLDRRNSLPRKNWIA